ncbi:hypothetical protein V3C99_006370, partial [Haemonchus contortus]
PTRISIPIAYLEFQRMSEMPMPLNPTDFIAAMSNSLNSAPMLTTKRETIPEDRSGGSVRVKQRKRKDFRYYLPGDFLQMERERLLSVRDFMSTFHNPSSPGAGLTTEREKVPEDWSDESSEEKESRNFQFSDSPRVKTSEKEIKDILTATHKFASLVTKWTAGSKKNPKDLFAKTKKTRLVDVFQMVDGLERAAKELDSWYQKGPAKIRSIAEELKRTNSLDLSNSLNCQKIDCNLRCVQQVLDQFPNFHDTNITEERPPGVAIRYMYSD